MDPEQGNFDFEQLLGVLRRRAPLILLCFVLAAGAAFGFSKHQTKKYTAIASLAFGNNQLSQQVAGLTGGSSSSPLAQQASNLALVKLGDTASKTANLLGHGLTEEKVSESLSVAAQEESSIVNVSATATSPVLAAAIANAYSGQFVKEQQRANRRYFKAALALVNKELATLTPQQRFGAAGVALQDRAQTLDLLAGLKYGDVQIAQKALVPSSPSSPKTSKNTLIGGLLGLVIGVGLAFLLEGVDRRIRDQADLEAIYRLPMLGVVPESTALSRSSRQDGVALLPAEAEAFSLIRAHLRFFNIDREVCTVVIASPTQGDGKSTIARHLAQVAAGLGSRVLLLEADLRYPTLARQLGIQAGPGLADVLINSVTMQEATQVVELHAGHTLDVLVAGAVMPPNPGELLESRAMDAVLEQVKTAYDLVVTDTPPLTAVSDAFPLLTKVDGVIIVGRVGHSLRDSAEQLQKVLAGSDARLLGIIANGSKSGGLSPHPGGGKSSSAVVSPHNTSSSEELAPTATS